MSRGERLTLFLLLVGAFLVYQPGLYGDYVFDDMANITYNKKLVIDNGGWREWVEASFSSFSGVLKRPVSMFTFAVNASTTGMQAPLYFKLTNLFIHLANGLLVYWLARLMVRRIEPAPAAGAPSGALAWTPMLVAALWLLHPLNLTSVLYIVQRMTSLSALFSFLAVALYLVGRSRLVEADRRGWWWILGGVLGAGSLAVLSKENGVLIPLLLLVVEITLFRFAAGRHQDVRRLKLFFIFTVLVPALVFIGATLIQSPRLYGGYAHRDFDMAERLMTEARAIFFYVQMAVIPRLGEMGLYHDDFAISRSLTEPWTTVPALLGVVSLLCAGVALVRRCPPVAFGILWYFAGHALESTTLPLELVHEHRNYLPLFGPIFTLCYYAGRYGGSLDMLRFRRASLAVLCALAALVTYLRAEQWGNSVLFSIEEARNHPESERANQQLGRTYVILYEQDQNSAYAQGAEQAYRRAIAANSISVIPLVSLLQLQMRLKQPAEPATIDQLVYRLGKEPHAPSVISAMRTLIDCQMFAYCVLVDADINRIFEAALRNPRATPATTSMLRLVLAQYEVDKRGDLAKGISLIEDALRDSPNSADLHLNMARVYRIARQFDLAEAHLRTAQNLNSLGYMTEDLAEEAARLDRDRKNGGRPL